MSLMGGEVRGGLTVDGEMGDCGAGRIAVTERGGGVRRGEPTPVSREGEGVLKRGLWKCGENVGGGVELRLVRLVERPDHGLVGDGRGDNGGLQTERCTELLTSTVSVETVDGGPEGGGAVALFGCSGCFGFSLGNPTRLGPLLREKREERIGGAMRTLRRSDQRYVSRMRRAQYCRRRRPRGVLGHLGHLQDAR